MNPECLCVNERAVSFNTHASIYEYDLWNRSESHLNEPFTVSIE